MKKRQDRGKAVFGAEHLLLILMELVLTVALENLKDS